MTPYIGITGFTSPEQVRAVFQGLTPPTGRKFMVGVLSGDETLRGISTQWDSRRPSPSGITDIFSASTNTLNLIHFRSASIGDALLNELIEVTKFGGPDLHGLQLNMTWPAPSVVKHYCSQFPKLRIVLQVGTKSFEEIQQDATKLLHRLEGYKGLIDYVLLDKSEGLGQALDPHELIPYVKAIFGSSLDIGVVVAGGLSADTMRLLESLTPYLSGLSIDAEGRLRTLKDELDTERCRAYLFRALDVFQ